MANNIFHNTKEFINKVEEIFGPKKVSFIQRDSGKESKKGLIYRQELVNQICKHFVERFEEETTDRSISYPVSFVIYLHPRDYDRRYDNFEKVVSDSVSNFYSHINKYLDNPHDEYQPDSTYWLFQLVNFEGRSSIVDVRQGEILEVKEGDAVVFSSLRSIDFSNKDNVSDGGSVKSTFHAKDSMMQHDFDYKSMISLINELPNGKWRLKYSNEDRKNEKVKSKITNPDASEKTESDVYAKLTCSDKFIGRDGNKGSIYTMEEKLIFISGKNDTREGKHIAKIDSDEVMASHVQIKYIPETKKFQLAAFGDTKLSERKVELSSGGDMHWKDLPNNSQIFINNQIGVTFKITKK
jgi:hypothetical protein